MSALFALIQHIPDRERRAKIMDSAVRAIQAIEREADNLNLSSGGREVFYSTIVEGLQETRRMLPIDGPVPLECRDV